jgi:hypothetical protein
MEIILDIAKLCTSEEKEGVLTEVYVGLLKDNNKWVRISAYKNLGPFIHEVKGKIHP